MADLKKEAISRLARVSSVDMNAVAATTLLTVPVGMKAVITHVIIRDVSADAIDCRLTLGQSSAKTDWLNTQDVGENLTAAAKAMILYPKDGNLYGSTTWDPGSIADGAEEAKDVTVTGAELGDIALASFSLDITDLELSSSVTAANTVTAVLANNTGGAIDLASGTLRSRVLKLTPYPPVVVEYAASTVFVVDITTAAGGVCTASFDVYGNIKAT